GLNLGLGGSFSFAGFDLSGNIGIYVGLTITNNGVGISGHGDVSGSASLYGNSLGSYDTGFSVSGYVSWGDLYNSVSSTVDGFSWDAADQVASTLSGAWNTVEHGLEDAWNATKNWFESWI